MQWNWVRSLVLPRGRPCGGVAEAVPIGLGKHTPRQDLAPATSAEISNSVVPGNDPEIGRLLAQGRQAEEAADWPAAEKHWRRAIGRGANEISAFLGLSAALRHQDRLPEAEAFLRDALVRLPPDLDCLMGYAGMADQRQDWAAAEQRWEALGKHFLHMWCACLGRTKAMCELDRPDEAVALLSGAAIRYPREPAMLYLSAYDGFPVAYPPNVSLHCSIISGMPLEIS
jgi:tetratricopeptide (TPR) repeat protein